MPSLPFHLAPVGGGPLSARSDDELMTLAQAGLRDAFAVLVERYAARLVSACARFVGDAQSGRELAQDTWLAVWSERARYRRDGRFVVWLHTMARNRCRNHLRHRGVTQSYARTIEAERADGRAGVEIDRLLEEERELRVQHALARLPEAMREALVLRFSQELRYDEIASVLRVRESTLRSRVHHGLKLLRSWLGRIMTRSACPDEARLTRYVDRDLSPEDGLALSDHVHGCARCREHVGELRDTLAALRAPVLSADELATHVRDVMARLDATPPAAIGGRSAQRAWLAIAAVAACICLSVGLWRVRPHGIYQARGSNTMPTIARDIGVQAYAFDEGALRPLTPGAEISSTTPLGAGYRNLGVGSAYLLLFAVDARDLVHWISPRYDSADSDPEATRLALTADESFLPERVIFDDLTPGSLRIVSVVTPTLAHVSDIEALEAVGASSQAITRRLPHAEVRELRVIVKGNTP